jgi:HPt (histidine-containing phosphotransfer) domain-containing protein
MAHNMQAALKSHTPSSAYGRPIDLVHLTRQTMGDRALETEILAMFSKQMSGAKVSFANANLDERKRLAHTVKGTARSVGAFNVADVAERIENAPLNSNLLRELNDEIAEVLNFIAAINR